LLFLEFEGVEKMSQAQLDVLLKPLIKTACLLDLSPADSAQAASDSSKFGGLPYAEKGQVWPCCNTCDNALTFVAQLKSLRKTRCWCSFIVLNAPLGTVTMRKAVNGWCAVIQRRRWQIMPR
jgi:hypothetical protein